MTPAECAKILSLLTAAYPRFEVSDGTIAVYTECLADSEFGETRLRALQLIRTSKFFPTVAELRGPEPRQVIRLVTDEHADDWKRGQGA